MAYKRCATLFVTTLSYYHRAHMQFSVWIRQSELLSILARYVCPSPACTHIRYGRLAIQRTLDYNTYVLIII